jgi:acyl carrier protein
MSYSDDDFFGFLSTLDKGISATDKDDRDKRVTDFWEDSVDVLSLLAALEEEYGVRVDDSEIEKMAGISLLELCENIRRHMEKAP